jgi:peptidoglycan-associated lipoprotein
MTKYRKAAGAIGVLLLASGIACQKKTAVLTPPPAPSKVEVAEAPTPKPDPPTITTFVTDPSSIERGHSAALRWVVKDATQIEIDQGLGGVAAVGQREVSPMEDTTYTIRATGPGGEASAATTLAVSLPPPVPAPVTALPTISERLANEVGDIFFDFDKSEIRTDARAALIANADALKSILNDFPTHTVILEGHCDERGSAEYNVALGDRRASSTKTLLGQLGVATERLQVISYGKERPQCTISDEDCWQKNRRVHFAAGEDQDNKAAGF